MSSIFWATIALGITFLLILLFWWGIDVAQFSVAFENSNSSPSIGDWGDSFGGINALLSGLAFFGVAITIFLQRESLRRHENEMGHAEFERVFFQLLGLIREQRSEIIFYPPVLKSKVVVEPNPYVTSADIYAGILGPGRNSNRDSEYEQAVKRGEVSQGASAQKSAYRAITRSVVAGVSSVPDARKLETAYMSIVHKRHGGEFGPYFRNIYSLIRRIDENRYLSDVERIEYSRLLRSQMTSYEAILLGLNGLSEHSKDLFMYIEKYKMLKYSQDGRIRRGLELIYARNAFNSRRK
ncbi:MAG: hypothetical protein ACJAQU_000334 [Loktanella salsilacus]